MGAILICEHGTADCYVEKAGESLVSISDAFNAAVPVVLGALVVVALLFLGRWLIKKIKV